MSHTTLSASSVSHHQPPNNAARIIAVDARNWLCRILKEHNDQILVDGLGVHEILPQLAVTEASRYAMANPGDRLVFVLDAPPKPKSAKQPVLQHRAEQREIVKKEVEQAIQKGNVQEARVAAKRKGFVKLGRQGFHASVKALRDAGFGIVQAPGEAEAQGAYWVANGHAHAVASADFDAFLFGATRVLRAWPRNVDLTHQREILRASGAPTHLRLIEAHVLAGRTDFAPAWRGIKSVQHALHAIERSGSMERLLAETPGDAGAWYEALFEFVNPNVTPGPVPHGPAWGLLN